MAAPTTSATNTVELDAMAFESFINDTLKKQIALKHKGVGSSILNRQQPHIIPDLLTKRPQVTELAINDATGKPAIPARLMYPRKEPSPADIAAAIEQHHVLTMWDLDMTQDAKKQFSEATKQYEILAKDRKAEIIEANKNDSNCGTDILSLLGPRTMVQLENNAKYQLLLATPSSDDVQSSISFQIITILYDLFHSGSVADMVTNFIKFIKYTPDATSTAAEIIQTNQRLFKAAFGAITDPITNQVSADDIQALLLIHVVSMHGQNHPYAMRALHACLTMKTTNILPSTHTVQSTLMEESLMSTTLDTVNKEPSEQAAAFKATVHNTKTSNNTANTNTSVSGGGGGGGRKPKTHPTPCSWCLAAVPPFERHGHTSAECFRNPKNKGQSHRAAGHIATISSPASIAPTADSNELSRLKGQNEAYLAILQLSSNNNSPSDASVMTTNNTI